MTSLRELSAWSTDKDFQDKYIEMKVNCKKKLQHWVKEKTGIDIPLNALYDVMIKRLHEYKRQLMNILYVIHRYLMIKDTPVHERQQKFI
jgi:starch phosphorylase